MVFIHDNVEDNDYYLFADICEIMNEQQAIIDGLKEKLCEFGVSDVKINGERINTGLEEWLEEEWLTESDYLKYKLENERKENEQLKQELDTYTAPNCKKCMNYCQDEVSDYCLVDEREDTYFAFPYGWNYNKGAKECEYYDE